MTGDEVLTTVANMDSDYRLISVLLGMFSRKELREAADLCGVDSVELSARRCAVAILENM